MIINGGHWVYLLILLLIVGGVVAVVLALTHGAWRGRALQQPPAWTPPFPQQALAELDLRYARGEIPREEYLQRRADLLGHPGAAPPSAPVAGPTPQH